MNNRRLLVGIVAVVVIALLGYTAYNNFVVPPKAATPTPAPSAAQNTEPNVVSAEAQVVPVQQAKLTFRLAGRVAELPVKEGDQVKAGTLLAKLDTHDLENSVRQAEASLASAEAQLAKARTGARPEEIAQAEAGVAIAQQGVAQAEAAVGVSRGNLAQAQAGVGVAQANLNKVSAGATARDLEIAQNQIELARNNLYASQGQRDALGLSKQNPLSATKGSYDAAQGQVQANQVQVRIAELQYEQMKAGPRGEDIAAAKAQVAQAQAGVTIAQAELNRAQKAVDTAAAQLQQAQAQADVVKAGARAEDIKVAEAGVAQAQAALETAQATLKDAVLTAPFDGVIGQINTQVGELAAPTLPVLTVGDLSTLRVETSDLSEVDVQAVKPGQDVDVSVDALPGRKFKGKVALIAPQAVERRGDTVYTVKVDLLQSDPGLRWGMTAFTDIHVGK